MDKRLVISVVIPTRNRAHYLKRSLDRILESDYPHLEIIVMDGASSDDTVTLLKSYGDKIAKWVSEKDGGEYYAIDKGLNLATGDIIKLMSDDDILMPAAFGIAARYFDVHPEVDVLFGQTRYYAACKQGDQLIDDKPVLDERSVTVRNWIRRSIPPPCSIASFIRTSALKKYGRLSMDYYPGDAEYWPRLAARGAKMAIVPEHFVDYYFTGTNGVFTNDRQCQRTLYRAACLYGSVTDRIYTLFWNVLMYEVVNSMAKACHVIHFHPMRRWFNKNPWKSDLPEA